MRRTVACLLSAGACMALSAIPTSGAAKQQRAGAAVSPALVMSYSNETVNPLRLRGGGPKEKGKGPVGKGKNTAAADDDELQEIGGLRPEPFEEDEGDRETFHELKQQMIEKLRNGEVKVSETLLSRKKDRNKFDKVCTC